MKKFNLETKMSSGITSYYVLTDMKKFNLDDAWNFLEGEVDDETFEKLEFIEEEESVAQFYNYKTCLIFHDTAKLDNIEQQPERFRPGSIPGQAQINF